MCHNPEEERRRRAHQAKVLEELDAELKSLGELSGGKHCRRVCQLRASGRYGRHVVLEEKGKAKIGRRKVTPEEQADGKLVVHSNDDALTEENMALRHKQLMRVEQV